MDKPYERLRNDAITILKAFDEVMHAKMGDTVTIRTDKGVYTRPATDRDTIDFFKSEWEDTVMRLNEIGIDLEEESKPLESEKEGGKNMEERYDFGEIVSLNAALIIYAMGVQVVVTDGRYLQISKEEK